MEEIVACWHSSTGAVELIHPTAEERIEYLKGIVWSTPQGRQVRGIVAWFNPPKYSEPKHV